MNVRKAMMAGFIAIAATTGQGSAAKPPSVDEMLADFAADYTKDPMAIDADFGVRIGDDWWRVHVIRSQAPVPYREKYTFHKFGPHQVTVEKGQPETPTWYFEFADIDVLRQVHSGALAAGTGAMRSFSSDKVMVDINEMDEYTPNQADTAVSYHTLTHFWTMGIPEITYFDRENSLPTHGAGAVSLYTMKDKRLLWFSLMKDEAANADPRLEESQIPNLMIITKGSGLADFGDGKIEIKEGMSIFIGSYVKHVVYNPNDEPLEGIVVLFGDNSDFVYGKSYLDLLEGQYEFLREYPFKEAQ